MKNVKGITLIALVITIVVMLILSGVVLSLTIGERGVFNLAQRAGSKTNREEATEKINLKITEAQMKSYIEKQRMPNLQELADAFCEDGDFEYVLTSKKEIAGILEKINIGISPSIFVKLEDYTYEFEIDSSLRLASIDGVRLATAEQEGTDGKVMVDEQEYEALKEMVAKLATDVYTKEETDEKYMTKLDTSSLTNSLTSLQEIVADLSTSVDTLNTKVNDKRFKTLWTASGGTFSTGTITLNEDMTNFDFLIIDTKCYNGDSNGSFCVSLNVLNSSSSSNRIWQDRDTLGYIGFYKNANNKIIVTDNVQTDSSRVGYITGVYGINL